MENVHPSIIFLLLPRYISYSNLDPSIVIQTAVNDAKIRV